MAELTLGEIVRMRNKLEDAFANALRELEKESGLQIISLSMERMRNEPIGHAHGSFISRVVIGLELPHDG